MVLHLNTKNTIAFVVLIAVEIATLMNIKFKKIYSI